MEKEQIIKALECCTSSNSASACMSGCPLYEKEDCECINDDTALLKHALALIKSQDEQVFKLENRIAECENGYSQTLALERARIKELSAENHMLRLLRADDGLAVVDYAVDSIRAMKFNTVRKMQEALKERIKGDVCDRLRGGNREQKGVAAVAERGTNSICPHRCGNGNRCEAYLDEDEMCAVIDEVAEKILNIKYGG